MRIRCPRWDGYQDRLMIDGRQHTAMPPTREEARDWERITRARALTDWIRRSGAVHQPPAGSRRRRALPRAWPARRADGR